MIKTSLTLPQWPKCPRGDQPIDAVYFKIFFVRQLSKSINARGRISARMLMKTLQNDIYWSDMTESQITEELEKDPFRPIRLHLVSGKTVDLLRPGAAFPLRDSLLVFRNLAKNGRSAEGYAIISYHNIEQIEQLDLGKRMNSKRKPAS